MVGIASFVHAKKGIWAIKVLCKVMNSFYKSSTCFAGNTRACPLTLCCASCPDHLEGALHLVQDLLRFSWKKSHDLETQ